MSRGDSHNTKVSLLSGLVVEGSALGSDSLELGEVKLAVAGEVEAGSLEIRLLGEQEDEAALLALVAARDVEVEDAGLVLGDFAKVGRSWRGVWVVLVNVDDEMGEFIRAVQVGRAGCWWWRRLAVAVASVGLESHLAAVGALVGLEVDVVLAGFPGGALIEFSLALVGEGAVTANAEAVVGLLALITLKDLCGS